MKKFGSLIAAFTLMISVVGCAGEQAYTEPLQITPYTAEVSDDSAPIEFDNLFSESLFKEPATVYNHTLAKVSIVVATSAWTKLPSVPFGEGRTGTDLERMGFENVTPFNYSDTGEDSEEIAAYTIGSRKVNGETMVAIVVRGTPNGPEWVGNMQIGGSDQGTNYPTHQNYQIVANDIISSVKAHLEQYAACDGKTQIWVMGHSRAGGVSELIGKTLDDADPAIAQTYCDAEKTVPLASMEKVYAYTFAPTAVVRTAMVDSSKDYSNIWGFANSNDFVPYFPTAGTGFGHVGNFKELPRDDASMAAMTEYYKTLALADFADYEDRSVLTGFLDAMSSIAPSVDAYYNSEVEWYDGEPMTLDIYLEGLAHGFYGAEVPERIMNAEAYAEQYPNYAAIIAFFFFGGMRMDNHSTNAYIGWFYTLPDNWVDA